MQDTRPYWKIAVSLLFSLTATILFVYVGWKLALYFMPFVIGWVISVIGSPIAKWLEKRLKIKKKLGSALIIILVLAAIVGTLYVGIGKLIEEIGNFIRSFPEMYQELESGIDQIGNTLTGILRLLPAGVRQVGNVLIVNFDEYMGEFINRISEPTMSVAGGVVKQIPAILVGFIVAVMSAYFFIADREEVLAWCDRVAPEAIKDRMKLVNHNFRYAVGGYVKAQLKIMVVVAVILLIGLNVIGVKYAVLLSILISFVDMIPFLGTGTIMIPWFLYKFLIGSYEIAVGLVVLYVITQVTRQLIQPKLVGDSMGLNPLLTLFLLYWGYKLGSVIGLLVSVPIGMIVINMYKAGAFDYLLDDVKILMEGVLSLRKRDEEKGKIAKK